jgi:hypothetical protein
MQKLVFAFAATAAVLCAGSLSSNRAEAMTLGETGIRPALQAVNEVDTAYYRRCWRGWHGRWHCRRHYHRHWY